MSKTDYCKCSNFFVIACLTIFIHFCTSAPVNVTEITYTQFVAELNRNKCSVPSQVQLPFDTTKVNNFEYLSSYLEICQKTEKTKRNKEAAVLCTEIFDNIRNVSCPPKTALPDIISVILSENVCQDIGSLKDSVPEDDKSLLKRLTDSFLCDIMCDSDFEKACQVLLWSFKVRKRIASVASAQKPEQPNVPEDGGDVNVDSFKQDNTVDEIGLPEISVDPENEKKNAKEAKDVNEIVGHDGITEVLEPSKLVDNPEQKLDTPFIPSGKEKQEKPVPNDKKQLDLENQAVPNTKSQDSTGASKSTSSTKTPTSLTQLKPGAQASTSNTEVKPVEEMTKDESDDPNANKQLQSDATKYDQVNAGVKPVKEMTKGESDDQNADKQLQSDATKYDQVNAGGELPEGSNTNAITDEQTQDVNANTLADRAVQDKKVTNILANGSVDNSNIPANQNIPVDDEDNVPGNEIPDETPEKGDQNSKFFDNNDLPHESANEKETNDAATDLHINEQNPSNLVNTIDQNKLQSTTSNDDSLAKKTNSPITNSQTIKDATQDKTSIARDEAKTDQPQTNSVSRKEEAQDHTKTDAITHDLITDDGTKNPSTDQKKPKVSQQTEEFDNTIPDPTGTSVIINEKPPEKSQKLKPTAVNPDGKSVIPSSLMETSTKTTVALEKMEGGSDLREPADDEADHFGDTENTEGDEYPGPDYGDGGFDAVSKNKASNPDVPGPIAAAKDIITSQNEKTMEFSSRNAFGQGPSDIQMISAFPEQEDGHFFFYFLSIVLILMAGYLIFHNKQKIIALIVEGRHERNRRSHRIGYKKLETK